MNFKNIKELPRDLFYIALIFDLFAKYILINILKHIRWKIIPRIKLFAIRASAKTKYLVKSRTIKIIYIITKATGLHGLAKKIQNKLFK